MSRNIGVTARIISAGVVLCAAVGIGRSALAGDVWVRRSPGPVVVTRARPAYAPTSTLGTFYPTPYMVVRGNDPVGGGYSPLGIYGDQTMSLYGPFSPLRSRTAPVRTYVRGYDGRIYVSEGTSFSNPNLPDLSPVVYPTEANNYFGPRVSRTPPWWSNAMNWIDQN
ncbi:MAG: hypothetical protein ACLQVF_16545 [Isosphaeraceae bacterium]